MKKVYFACSIRGGRTDAKLYGELVTLIGRQAQVISEIFADQTLTTQGTDKPEKDIWQIDTDWLRQADAIIAEVTTPSLGVGYEIAKAEEWGKPVLALYRPQPGRKLSAMIAGSPAINACEYASLDEAADAIEAFLGNLAA